VLLERLFLRRGRNPESRGAGRILVAVLPLLLALGAAPSDRMPCATAQYVVGDVVDSFTLPDLAGNPVSLADYLGDIVVLNFFATWCPGCNVEAEHLENDIWQVYRDEGVTVLAVDIQEHAALVQGWAAAMGVTYEILLAPDWELFQLFPLAGGIPYNAILDRDHILRYGQMGFDLNALTALIEVILDEGSTPVDGASWGSVKALYR